MAVFSSVSFSRMLQGSACTSAGSCVDAPCSSAPPKSNRPDCWACTACASAHSNARPTLASVQAVEAAGLDQRVDDALVDPRAVDPLGEVEDARERTRDVALLGAAFAR